MRLNLGCGTQHLENYVNIDIDPNVKPDECFDFTSKFPYSDSSVEQVVAYHVLEHIPKKKHLDIYSEIHRVLIPEGEFILTFPEFLSCVENWKNNFRGQKEFWEATIYGRQSSPHDYHICIMVREEVARILIQNGFAVIYKGTEPVETFNSLIKCTKDIRYTYEEALLTSIGL